METTIGIDVGGTKTLAVRVVGGRVAAEARVATDPGPPPGAAVVGAIRSIWSPQVQAVGAGIAGLVDAPAGVFAWGPHVTGTAVPVGARLEAEFGVPVVVDNDANMAAFAELRAGAGRGCRDLLLVTLGTGIGGAVVVGGEIYRGRAHAGEWGHMRATQDGPPCDCGRSGCWETLASGPALARMARRRIAADPHGRLAAALGDGPVDGEAVTRAAASGDEVARELIAEVGRSLGEGLADLVAIFDPEVVVVGGGLGSVGEMLLEPARRAAADELFGAPHRSLPPILPGQLGERANAIGAALLAAERFGS